jgi:hypothetical protein
VLWCGVRISWFDAQKLGAWDSEHTER